jgi:PhnB protein
MPTRLNPYLNFKGNAREAMEFYHSVLGGELTCSRFADMPGMAGPDEADKLLHAMLVADNGLTLMAADVPASMGYTPPAGFSVSLSGEDDATLRRYWEALTDGATVTEPLNTAPWGDTFGMLVDRFGISWLVNIAGPAT